MSWRLAWGIVAVAVVGGCRPAGRSKPEPELQLRRIAGNAMRVYSRTSSFAVGTAIQAPRRPGKPERPGIGGGCCSGGGPNYNDCPADQLAFTADPVWRELDFQLEKPGLYYYDYTGTKTSFTARATGDLDCDGTEVVYTLRGTVVNGALEVQFIEPAPDAD
jgi:hypothetical protein